MQVVDEEAGRHKALAYMNRLKKILRIHGDADMAVMVGTFEDAVAAAPMADINIFGMSGKIDISWNRKVADVLNSSVLFIRDSKHESAIV